MTLALRPPFYPSLLFHFSLNPSVLLFGPLPTLASTHELPTDVFYKIDTKTEKMTQDVKTDEDEAVSSDEVVSDVDCREAGNQGLRGGLGILIPNRGSRNSTWDINSCVLLANALQHQAHIRSRGGNSGRMARREMRNAPAAVRLEFNNHFSVSPFHFLFLLSQTHIQVLFLHGLSLTFGESYFVQWELVKEDYQRFDCFPEGNADQGKCLAKGCIWEV